MNGHFDELRCVVQETFWSRSLTYTRLSVLFVGYKAVLENVL